MRAGADTYRTMRPAVALCAVLLACRPATRPTPRGELDRDAIREVVRAHIADVVSCYNARLAEATAPFVGANITFPAGRVTVRFTIGPTGSVLRSKVASNETGDPALGRCVARAVKHWRFPRPAGGGDTVVTYPFALDAR